MFESMIFNFMRGDGYVIGQVRLDPDGTIDLYSSDNEKTWKEEDGNIVFMNSSGDVTTRFDRVEAGMFVGEFCNGGKHVLEPVVFEPIEIRPHDKPHCIYTVAYGEYAILVGPLVDTLRNEGQYKDEIIVLTNKPASYFGNLPATVMTIPTDHFRNCHPNLYRFMVKDFIKTEPYDQIMYLDVDIICERPIEPLFNAYGCVRYATENALNNNTGGVNLKCMTPEELEKYGSMRSINSGNWCCDSSYFQTLLDTIIKVANEFFPGDSIKEFKHDQSAYNTAIRRGMLNAKSWNDNLVNFGCFARKGYRDQILMHYNRTVNLMADWYSKSRGIPFDVSNIKKNGYGRGGHEGSSDMTPFIGKVFTFGRGDGSLIGQLRLDDGGRIGLYSHSNEKSWKVEGEDLCFIDRNRNVSTRFKKVGERWEGSFLGGEVGGHWLAEEHFEEIKPASISGKPHCIYMTVYGKEYESLALMCIDTLRVEGKYTGDILVFTDNTEWLNGVQASAVIFNDSRFKSYHPVMYRLLVADMIRADKYDQIMYLDADILCKKPIEPMFNAEGCLRYSYEFRSVGSWSENKQVMSDDVFSKHSKKILINGGQFCIDAKCFMEVMSKILASIPNRFFDKFGPDQAALNNAVYEQSIPAKKWNADFVNFYDFNRKTAFDDSILMHGKLNNRMEQEYTKMRENYINKLLSKDGYRCMITTCEDGSVHITMKKVSTRK